MYCEPTEKWKLERGNPYIYEDLPPIQRSVQFDAHWPPDDLTFECDRVEAIVHSKTSKPNLSPIQPYFSMGSRLLCLKLGDRYMNLTNHFQLMQYFYTSICPHKVDKENLDRRVSIGEYKLWTLWGASFSQRLPSSLSEMSFSEYNSWPHIASNFVDSLSDCVHYPVILRSRPGRFWLQCSMVFYRHQYLWLFLVVS